MHAAYAFIMNTDDFEALDAESINAQFESDYGDLTDENNWYQPMLFVGKDGTLVQLAGAGDWRGRDSWYEQYNELPKEERFARALQFSWTLIGVDLELFESNPYQFGLDKNEEDVLSKSTPEQILEEIYKVPGKIAKVLMARDGVAPTQMFDLDLYKARKAFGIYDAMMYSVMSNNAPFCDPSDPYKSIRAQVLGYNEIIWESDQLGIMFVDIHT